MTAPAFADDIIHAAEASALLGCSVRALYRLAAAGRVPHWRIGRDVRFSREKLIAWRNSGGTAAPNALNDQFAA